MRRGSILAALGLTTVTGFLLGLVAMGPSPNGVPTVAHPPVRGSLEALVSSQASGSDRGASEAAAIPVDFSSVAARVDVNGAVVNVDASAGEPDERSRFVYPRRWSDDVREGSGSGFIIDPAGTILTNYHVVSDAGRVTVTLRDGRAFRASIVGVDPAIDVALLQISAHEALPAIPMGHSGALRVGEWVCAIGNPLGYVHSVTVGVISFLGRKVFDPGLDALIQTDAAITFGNSGGPLINLHGEVVGITTAISAQAANIGFAVPIDQVIAVLPQLRETGRVTRGDLGLGVTAVTPALQRALGLGTSRGAVIQDVGENTPGERAGLRAYDVVVAADGQPIDSDEALNRFAAARAPGSIARLEVVRDGESIVAPVKLAERPLPPAFRTQDTSKVRPAASVELLGVSVVELDAATLKRRNMPDTLMGVLIASVDPVGPARVSALKAGQVILEVNRGRVTRVAEYRAALGAVRPGAAVALLVYDPPTRQRLIHVIVTDPLS